MEQEQLQNLIKGLEIVQIRLMQQRRDHNGQVLQKDDIEQMNITIEIINNLIIDNKYIWRKKE